MFCSRNFAPGHLCSTAQENIEKIFVNTFYIKTNGPVILCGSIPREFKCKFVKIVIPVGKLGPQWTRGRGHLLTYGCVDKKNLL